MPLRSPIFFLVFLGIAVVPCRADIVPVSVSQQLSVSGGVMICDPTTRCSDYVSNGFSSSDSNALLPPKPLSVSGAASVAFDPWTLSGNASASQGLDVTPHSIGLGLEVISSFLGPAHITSANGGANNQTSLVFDLTSPALLKLTGNASEGLNTSFLEFTDLTFDEEVHLAGPGFQFDQVLPPGLYSSAPFSEQFVLAPGEYTLTAFANSDLELGYSIWDGSSSVNLSLSADFTNIPEPSHIAFVLGLCMAGGVWLARGYAH